MSIGNSQDLVTRNLGGDNLANDITAKRKAQGSKDVQVEKVSGRTSAPRSNTRDVSQCVGGFANKAYSGDLKPTEIPQSDRPKILNVPVGETNNQAILR